MTASSLLKPQPRPQLMTPPPPSAMPSVATPLGPKPTTTTTTTTPIKINESMKTPNNKSNESDLPLPTTIISSPPPLKYIDINPNQRLSPLPPPSSDGDRMLLKAAEDMVHWAISSRHENSLANNAATTKDGITDNSDNIRKAASKLAQLTAILKSKPETPQLLCATLHAITSSNSGRELDLLVTNSKLHASLIHFILRLDPFVPPSSATTELRKLDGVRLERTKGGAYSPKSRRGVQIAESSIRHKEDTKYVTPAIPYFSYQVTDVHLHLLVTLVSNNSILGMSAVRSIWGMLTEFGGRWMDWGRKDVERTRKMRRLRQQQAKQSQQQHASGRVSSVVKKEKEEKEAEDVDGMQPPPAKRRRVGTPQKQQPQESIGVSQSSQSTESHQGVPQAKMETGEGKKEEEEEEVEPENERPVPGMSGLSVEFVRDAFYSNHDGERGPENGMNALTEEIHSDRLASGRVRRLLLTLANIFRLCPRSKLDVQRLMSSNFPHHKTTHPALHKWYSHVCLQMVRLAPTFEGPVLRLFVDKALDMDVEIKINERGLVSLDSSNNNDGDVEEEGGHITTTPVATKKRSFQKISHGSSLITNSPIPNKSESTAADVDDESDHVMEISERLDSLMTGLHSYILHATSFDPSSLPQAVSAVLAARRLHRHLASVFDAKVRTTDRSKFVQFAFFVLFGRENDAVEAVSRLVAERESKQQQQQQLQAGDDGTLGAGQTTKGTEMDANPEIVIPTSAAPINVTDPLYRGFSAKLIDFFYNPSHTTDVVPRQTVLCYLASFVSRAKYVCPETVCECIAALLRWAEAYIDAQPSSKSDGDGNGKVRRQSSTMASSASRNGNTQHQCEKHALFYTACQAAFYMMCFRGYEGMGYYRRAVHQHQLCKDDRGDDTDASMSESQYADPDSVDIGPKRWKLICSHALQPLKYCLESVRSEFLHLAKDLDLFLDSSDGHESDEMQRREEADKFLDHLQNTSSLKKQQAQGDEQSSENQSKNLPRAGPTPAKKRRHSSTPMKKRGGGVKKRRRTIISTAATREKKRLNEGVGGLGRGSNPLGSFFPFDPYLLQTSFEHVRPYYRNWEDCILTIEGEEVRNAPEKEKIKAEDDCSILYTDDDDYSYLSDLDDEENVEEGESDDDDEEEDGYQQRCGSGQKTKPQISLVKGVELRQEDDHFEMEIRRSRAMSTGSQCSW